MVKINQNPAENELYREETADITREKINDVLFTMGVITPEERRGTKYVRVEEDGGISFNRDFMLNILKESSVIIPPKISDKDLAKMFAEIVLGDEFEFFVGNAKIKAIPSTAHRKLKLAA